MMSAKFKSLDENCSDVFDLAEILDFLWSAFGQTQS